MADREQIINRLLQNSAEIITADEFKSRLASGDQLTHYIGFEISGYVHIGQGLMSALIMKDLTDLGVKCTVWLADLHTAANDKLDGTQSTAAAIGRGYFTESLKACFASVGGDADQIEFRLASDWYGRHGLEYINTLVQVSKHITESRIKRSISIMGKEAGESVDMASLIYPLMQVSDIFFQGIDIAHASMDQRKAHVVMRDTADKIYPDQPKPVAIHHPLIDSLTGDKKMSKSRPDSAVFIHDTPEEIARKINKAFCPEKEIEKNPILNWTKHLLFWNRGERSFIVVNEKEGGQKDFATYQDLEQAYTAGKVHPQDLKAAVAKELIDLLKPVREHFAQPEIAAQKAELDKVLKNR